MIVVVDDDVDDDCKANFSVWMRVQCAAHERLQKQKDRRSTKNHKRRQTDDILTSMTEVHG